MKQNSFWFFMVTVLTAFALMGVPYMLPYMDSFSNTIIINGDPTVVQWDLINNRMNNDTGLELSFPMYSLLASLICAIIFAATQKYRVVLFVLGLTNMLFVLAIPTLIKLFLVLPLYVMENGYYMHVVSSIILLILSITALNRHVKKEKTRKHRSNDALLDDLI